MRIGGFKVNARMAAPITTGYIPTGVQMTGAPALWPLGYDGTGKVAALIDSGVDVNHPDLAGRIIDYIDLTGEGQQDDLGHGTHVAGTICACGQIKGVAPGARLLVIKVFGAEGSCEDTRVVDAIKRAVAWRGPLGERISAINLSLGSPNDTPELHEAIRQVIAANAEPVCAAGNDGDNDLYTSEYSYPGAYAESVEVAAITGVGAPTKFSNTNDQIDMCAVGMMVDSCWPGGGYANLSGTSMATPHITGCLLIEEQMFEAANGRPFKNEAERWAFAKRNVKIMNLNPLQQGLGLGYLHPELAPVKPVPQPQPEPTPTPIAILPPRLFEYRMAKGTDGLIRVQFGAFSITSNADNEAATLVKYLTAAGGIAKRVN